MQRRLKNISMNLKIITSIKKKLKKELNNKEILDIILFGSAVKGKTSPQDIDLAIISNKTFRIEQEGFHFSLIKPEEFFIKPQSIITTLLREGYSLKHNKPFSEIYDFKRRVLFKYELKDLSGSLKVRIVQILKGNKNKKGLVNENHGEWIANQVFLIPSEDSYIFDKFFQKFKVNFNKYYILIH